MAARTINRDIVGPDRDPSHPIADLNTVDLITENRLNGGLVLAILPSGPLAGDARTQTRLVEKVGAYLHYIASAEFKAEFGPRGPKSTSIAIKAHQGCAPEIQAVLKMCAKWASESGVPIVLEIPEG